MFDSVACSQMELGSQPHVRWDALVDLKQLLDSACWSTGGMSLENRLPPPTLEETDAIRAEAKTADSNGAVQITDRSAHLAGAPASDPQRSDAGLGAVAGIGTPAAERKPGGGK